MHRRKQTHTSFRQALRVSLRGIRYAFHSETNMRRHFWLFHILVFVELILRPSITLVTVSMFAAMCVFAAELLNTAVENAVDLAIGKQHHPLAAIAKDTAAGAVTMISIGSLFVALWIICSTFPWGFRFFSNVHLLGASVSVIGLFIIWLLRWWPVQDGESSLCSVKED